MVFIVEYKSAEELRRDTMATVESQSEKGQMRSRKLKFPSLRRKSSATTEESSTDGRHHEDKSHITYTTPPPSERRRSTTSLPLRLRRKKLLVEPDMTGEERARAALLGEKFFSLPSEILTSIFSYLDLQDIYNLRRTSPSVCSIIDDNASTVSRHILRLVMAQEALPHVLNELYPIPSPCDNLQPCLRLLRRQRNIDRTIQVTLSFIQMRMYMLAPHIPNGVAHSSPNRQRLISALQSPAWTVNHFIERYQHIVIVEHEDHESTGSAGGQFWECGLCSRAVHDLVESYPTNELLPAYHFYGLLLAHLRAAMREPYNGTPLERKLRGRKEKPVSDDDLSILLILGGLAELKKISMMHGSYSNRRDQLNKFVGNVRWHVASGSYTDVPNKQNKASGKVAARRNSTAISTTSSTTNPSKDDVTTSLDLPFTTLKHDLLERLPVVNDYFLSAVRERIEREELGSTDDGELDNPFGWVQNVLYGLPLASGKGQRRPNDGDEEAEEDSAAQDGAAQQQQPTPAQQQTTASNAGFAARLVALNPHVPRHLPYFGAPPL